MLSSSCRPLKTDGPPKLSDCSRLTELSSTRKSDRPAFVNPKLPNERTVNSRVKASNVVEGDCDDHIDPSCVPASSLRTMCFGFGVSMILPSSYSVSPDLIQPFDNSSIEEMVTKFGSENSDTSDTALVHVVKNWKIRKKDKLRTEEPRGVIIPKSFRVGVISLVAAWLRNTSQMPSSNVSGDDATESTPFQKLLDTSHAEKIEIFRKDADVRIFCPVFRVCGLRNRYSKFSGRILKICGRSTKPPSFSSCCSRSRRFPTQRRAETMATTRFATAHELS